MKFNMRHHTRATLVPSLVALVLGATLSACGDDTGGGGGGDAGGEGRVTFTTWGEEYIEAGIPASEFADGWSVKYDRFLVTLGDITIADADGNVGARSPGFTLVDHVSPGVKPVTSVTLGAKAWEQVSYQTSPPPADGLVVGAGATEADRDAMLAAGCHLRAVGALTNGAVTKSFDWCFGIPTLLDACEGELDGKLTKGVVVTEGGEEQVQLTIHGDHLFYDDLQAANAVLRGQAIADADADADGVVTLEELAAVDLDDLPPEHYGTGSASSVANLRDYVSFLSRTMGHYRGEGECFVKSP
jgi:hypothetical protein